MIEYLVEIKSDKRYGEIALHLACRNENISFEIIKYLIENKSDLNSKDERNNIALHLACRNENISLK